MAVSEQAVQAEQAQIGVAGGVADLPVAELESQIVGWSARLSVATARWLALVGEYDAREAWKAWECSSCAAWLAWHCHLDARTAREHVRVARALRALPAIAAEFGAGRLTYSKVRAVTRVATVATDRDFSQMAVHANARQLERIVGGVERARGDGLAGSAERQWRHRGVFVGWDEDGSVVLRVRLPADDGAALLAVLHGEAGDDRTPEGLADALVRALLDDADSRSRTDEGDAERAVEAVGGGSQGPSSGGGRCEVGSAGPPRSDRTGRPERRGRPVAADRSGRVTATPRALLAVHVAAADLAAGRGAAEVNGRAVELAVAERLACDAVGMLVVDDADGHPLRLGRRRRLFTPAIRRALERRDGCCAFPACGERRGLAAHHVVHWTRGGRTDLDNAVLLCRKHHRAVHEGGWSLTRQRDGRVVVRRPDGTTSPAPASAVPPPEEWPVSVPPPWAGDRLSSWSLSDAVGHLLDVEDHWHRRQADQTAALAAAVPAVATNAA